MNLLKVSHSITELEYRNKALTPEIRKDLTNKIIEIVEQNECDEPTYHLMLNLWHSLVEASLPNEVRKRVK